MIADYIYPIIVSVSIITTLTTPFFIRGSEKIYALLVKLLPEKLVQKLERDTDEERSAREQDSDWGAFLRRYLKVTAFYGALMLGVTVIARYVCLPLLAMTPLKPWMNRTIATVLLALGVALFVRPMLDLHSAQYTTLWVKNRGFRLPLMALTGLRVLLIILIVFLPLQTVWELQGLWLLLPIAAAVFVIYKTGWMSAAYISVEAQFLATLNERQLQRADDDDTEWLDEKLMIAEFPCRDAITGKTLKELNWGHAFGVNVIKIMRGKRHFNMPSGDFTLRDADRVFVIGTADNLRSLSLSLSLPETALPTLRTFISAQEESGALYAYAIPVEKHSELSGSSIRDSGLRENYDCMVLGIQRNKLPILQPDVNMVIQSGDLVWVLGTKHMANKLFALDLETGE